MVYTTVAYWRKANQIHKWFVDNVQDGKDDCREYEVSSEQLQELVDTCKKVLRLSDTIDAMVVVGQRSTPEGEWEDMLEPGKKIVNPEFARELLPVQEGFFFGSYDYDNWYLRQLENTVEMLEAVLATDIEGRGWYVYDSSW